MTKQRALEALGWALALAVPLCLLGWGAAWVGDFIEDDTLISLRYSARLLDGQGLTWNDGERVEGYSNLAWVLGASTLGALGIDLILAVRILAFACFSGTLGALSLLSRRLGGGPVGFAGIGLALVGTSSLPVWTMGALEQPLVVCCLAVSVWAFASLTHEASTRNMKPLAWLAGSLATLVLTRPDGPIFVVLFAAATLVAIGRRSGLRRGLTTAVVVAGVPFAFWLAHLGFRLAYYGDWVPNTAHIKTHLTQARVEEGIDYVSRGLEATWLIVAVGAVGAVLALVRRETRTLAITLLVLTLAWTSYVMAIGGDHFPAFRHLLPLHLLLAALGAVGLAAWQPRGTSRQLPAWARWLGPAALLTVAALLPRYVESQGRVGEINVAQRARWQWDGQAVASTFATAWQDEQPLWAVTAAGCLPYFSGLPALDMLGLNDAHIAQQDPDPRQPLAHDHGDGKYVLDRAPDLVTFGLPRGTRPIYKSGHEMARDRRFRREYRMITFRSLSPISVLSSTYVRIGGKVGVRGNLEGESPLTVPGYMLRSVQGTPLPNGSLGAWLPHKKRAAHDLGLVPAGSYTVRLDPPNPAVRIQIGVHPRRRGKRKQAPKPTTLIPGSGDGSFIVTAESKLELELRSPVASTLVGDVVIERLAEPSNASNHEGSPKGRLVVQQPLTFAKATRSLMPESGFGNWKPEGEAFGSAPSTKRRPGQGTVMGKHGPFFNSFRQTGPDEQGDQPMGRLSSPAFSAALGSWLSFRIGGGRAEVQQSQVGVRLVDSSSGQVLMVFTGKNEEKLRMVKVDLGPFAGRELHLEVFDESSVEWGHVVADGFTLHE